MISSSIGPSQRARRQLRRLFPDDPDLTGAACWAAETLQCASLDPRTAPLRSLRTLRRADRRLSLLAARHLVELAAGRASPGGERRPLPPHLH